MKAIWVLACLILTGLAAPASAWDRTYGGANYDQANSIVSTYDGGYIVAGYTNSFGAGSSDAWLLRLDGWGDTVWTRTYGQTGVDLAWDVATIDGGYLLAGETQVLGGAGNHAWLLRLGDSGDTIWSRTFGGDSIDAFRSVDIATDGDYITAGYQHSFGSGYGDALIVKVAPSGDTLWSRTYGGVYDDFISEIVTTRNCEYATVGYTSSFGAGNWDAWVQLLDPSGNIIWSKTFGGTEDDRAASVAYTLDFGYIVAGRTASFGAGSADVWILKLDPYGDTLWTKTYGGHNFDCALSIAQTNDEGYIVAGYTESFGHGSSDAWILKLDPWGDTLWTRIIGGISADKALSVALAADGGYIVAGSTQSFSVGSVDAWIIMLDTLGAVGVSQSATVGTEAGQLAVAGHEGELSLRITLPRATRVRLELLNLAGEAVALLADQEMLPGETRLQVPCPKLAAGVYIIASNGTVPNARFIIDR